jgi:hypothetical protein
MAANPLDGSGSSGRPRAADQNLPTVRASAQSNVTEAILTVTSNSRVRFPPVADARRTL